jgi:hypothetical protein
MKRLVIFILAVFIGGVSILAQTEQIIIPGDLKQQTVITEPVTLRKGYLRAGAEGAFIIIDKVFDENGKRDYVLGTNAWGKFSGFQLALHYGITDRIEVGCKIPYINQQYFVSTVLTDVLDRTDSLISYRSTGRGLGDIEAGVRIQLIQESDRRPSITFGTVVTIPTGRKNPENVINDLQYDLPTGGGYYAWESFITMRKIFFPYSTRIRIHYEHYFPGTKIFFPDEPGIRFRNGDMFIAAGDFSVHLNDWIALTNELGVTAFGKNTYHYDPVETSPASWNIDYLPSLYFQVRRFRFKQGVIVPLYGEYLSADPTYAFGLSYIF